MKNILIAVLSVASGCATMSYKPSYPKPTVVSKTDEFNGHTYVVTEGSAPLESVDHARTARFTLLYSRIPPDLVGKVPDEVHFSVRSTNDEWEYLRCHHMDLLADNQQLHPDTEHDGSVGSGYVMESVSARLPLTYLQRLGTSKASKVRVCGDVYVIGESSKELLREFVRQARAPR